MRCASSTSTASRWSTIPPGTRRATLLRELSRILADRTRASDTLARLGGDEFGLLLFDCDLAEAEQVASKLIEQICSVRFPGKGGSTTGASIGITALTATSRSTSELMSQADVACYAAKHAGRNRVSVYQFGHEEVERQHRDILLASGLREALENDRFQLQAQEIVPVGPAATATGTTSCCCDCTIRMAR